MGLLSRFGQVGSRVARYVEENPTETGFALLGAGLGAPAAAGVAGLMSYGAKANAMADEIMRRDPTITRHQAHQMAYEIMTQQQTPK